MPFPQLSSALGTRVYLLAHHETEFIGSAATWKTAARILARWDNGEVEATAIDDR